MSGKGLVEAYLNIYESDMTGAPSIKDAKPAKKTNVKYDPHMKVMAPQVKEDLEASGKFSETEIEAILEALEGIEELYKGKHGQSEKEYQDGRSDAGKMISGDSKGSGANYSYKAKNTGPNPAGGSKKPQGQARMSSKDREYLKYRKANLKKEEIEVEEGYDEPKMHSAVKRVMGTQPAAKGRAASRLHSKYSMRSKGNIAGETDGPGPNAPKRSGRKGRGAETDRGSGNAAKRRMEK